jgi:hypothetical protein
MFGCSGSLLFDKERRPSLMKNCTDEQLARDFLLGAMQSDPVAERNLLDAGDQHGLGGDLLDKAATGLAVTKFKHRGEWCWQLPPNVLPFVVRTERPHVHRFTGGAHGGGSAA